MSKIKNLEKYKLAKEEYISNQDMTLEYLANKYGFSRQCFGKWLKDNGVFVKKRGRSKELSDLYEKGKEMYLNGKTMAQISKELSISKKSFSLYLHERIPDKIRNQRIICHQEFDKNYFDDIDTADKAYWLGFIYADGNVREGRMAIEISTKDEQHLYKFKECINGNMPITRRANNKTCSISLYSVNLAQQLMNKGLVHNKTKEGLVEFEKLGEYKFDFLRGLVDGDGYIDKKRYRLVIVDGSRKMIDYIVENLQEYSPKVVDKKTYCYITFSQKKNFFELLNKMYSNANIYLDRKYEIYLKRITALQKQS